MGRDGNGLAPYLYPGVLIIDPLNPSRLYAGTRGGGVFVFVEGTSWLYAGNNPSGAEAAFEGVAFTNLSHAEAPLDLEAITSTSSTASVRSRSPQGDFNRASVSLPSGQQTALLRTDLFEGIQLFSAVPPTVFH